MRYFPFLLAALVAVACSPSCGWNGGGDLKPVWMIESWLPDASGEAAILCLEQDAGWVPVREVLPEMRRGDASYRIGNARTRQYLFVLQAEHPDPENHPDRIVLVWNDNAASAFATLPMCDLTEHHRSYFAGRDGEWR